MSLFAIAGSAIGAGICIKASDKWLRKWLITGKRWNEIGGNKMAFNWKKKKKLKSKLWKLNGGEQRCLRKNTTWEKLKVGKQK